MGALMRHEATFVDAENAVRWIIDEGFARMPAVSEVLEAIRVARRLRLDRDAPPAMAAAGSWTPDDIARARETGARILADFRSRRPDVKATTIEDVVAKPMPVEFDPAEVERKRQVARDATEREASG